MIRIFWILILLLFISCKEQYKEVELDLKNDVTIGSHFDNGDRIYLKIPTKDKDSLYVFTDTGGGYTAIYPNVVKKFGWQNKIKNFKSEGESGNIIFSEEIIENNYYYPYLNHRMRKRIDKPFYFAPDNNMVSEKEMELADGFFGQFFFMGKAWTFDYLNKKVILHKELDLDIKSKNTQKVGFKKDRNNNPLFGHPSITIYVNGDEIPMLFDTGATFNLSKNAQLTLNSKETIGGSFIAQSVYEKWKKENPSWRVIENGDVISEADKQYSFDMIEVPLIKLGQYEVGPVWFSVRSDEAWSKYMIKTMDKVVKGAIGGSGLKYLVVSIDYKNELIEFRENYNR